MIVTVDIPDAMAKQLASPDKDLSQSTLEALAVDGHRRGKLTEGEVRQMLGLGSPVQVHQLLKAHSVYLQYSLTDLEADLQVARMLTAADSPVAA